MSDSSLKTKIIRTKVLTTNFNLFTIFASSGYLKKNSEFFVDYFDAEALEVLNGGQPANKVVDEDPQTGKWICRQCSMIYDPVTGDPDSGIPPGTAFTEIPDDWKCPICGASKKTFKPLEEKVAA